MALKDDALIIIAGIAGAWMIYDRLKPTAAFTAAVAAISEQINPPGFSALRDNMVKTDIQPTDNGGFTSGLADWVTGMPAGTVYAVMPDNAWLWIIDPVNGWYESAYTKQNLIDKSHDYYARISRSTWWPF